MMPKAKRPIHCYKKVPIYYLAKNQLSKKMFGNFYLVPQTPYGDLDRDLEQPLNKFNLSSFSGKESAIYFNSLNEKYMHMHLAVLLNHEFKSIYYGNKMPKNVFCLENCFNNLSVDAWMAKTMTMSPDYESQGDPTHPPTKK